MGLARAFGRSVWAVVDAFGLFLVTTYFVDTSDTIVDTVPLVPIPGDGDGLELWQTSLIYIGLGAVLVLLTRWLHEPTLHASDRT